MSKFNALANDEKYRPHVKQWVLETCPLIYLYAPSNTGKTTVVASLFPETPEDKTPLWTFKHDDYCKVLYIDGDQGSTTIEQLVGNPRLCDLRRFNLTPEKQLGWKAIVIEGTTATYRRLVADELRKKPGATGNELKRCYIGPSSHAAGLIDTIRQIKQHRIATKKGVPIVVILNTKAEPIDKDKPDAGTRYVPNWSPNLIENSMSGCDMHAQLTRDPTGTHFVTVRSEYHPYCKMRSAEVAAQVLTQINLNLPGLFALWASMLIRKTIGVRNALDKRDEPEQNQHSQPSSE
jgi:hypothetical protein